MAHISLRKLIFAGAALLVASTVAGAETVTLRLGNITDPQHSETKAQEYFAKLVEEKTNGEVKIRIFSGGQLGDAPSQLEAIRLGAQDMYAGGTGNFGKYVSDWNITTVGFVFRDTDHFMKVLDSEPYKKMEQDLLDKAGFRMVLRNGARPGKPVISTKPIMSPDDFKGLKVRVPPWEGFVKTFEAMGAKTVSLPWGETYLALKQGVAEVACATVSGFYGQSLQEVAPYLTLVDFFSDSFTIVIGDRKFQGLSPEHQQALLDAGTEAGEYYTKLAVEDQKEIIEKMIDDGAVVIRVNPEPFIEKMGPVVADMETKVWSTAGLFDAIQAIK
ncbi:TRAP transporter substrate-binding protein [Nitratireductor indicus]|uniref:TRAP dicarboxylate transporter subunit DctP n=1 Tax=Nitratireductor indicus C115 TaxID=1231190 RepID=K2PBL3_9HYPH|nr:TRAP transporter substrate-binding protein [Nitratireductor indicus]EKF44536.1 TRAP dicarboxylate transporter subunit DctP [Nitratireductor indicus C115]MDS1137487.1 TRAP transporter substrate-binding protein [Nitratireductor indicus]SFQ31071.1 tripartite ATP-independent transporter solute receptor, DctP family [Nitratireductor indicus]